MELVGRIKELSRPMMPMPTGVEPVLRRLDGIKAVLFDVYGTMVVSGSGDVGTSTTEIDSAVLAAEALRDAGFYPLSDEAGDRAVELYEATIRCVHAERKSEGVQYPEVDIVSVWDDVVKQMFAESALTGEIAESAVRRLAVEYECRVNPTWPMPGLLDVLAQFRARGTVLGIVSNSQFYTPLLFDALLNRSLTELGFEPHLCVWSFEELQGKPSSRLYSKAAARLRTSHGIVPEQALYIGNDMRNDVLAASQAGFHTALFAGDKRSLRWRRDNPRCVALTPDVVLTELVQVLETC